MFGIVLVTLVLLQHERTSRERDTYIYLLRTNHWVASQLEFELHRFLSTMDRFAYDAPGTDHERLMLHFDLLWSRVPVFLKGSAAAGARQVDGAVETVRQLRTDLRELEPVIRRLEPGDTEARNRIARRLDPYREPLREITVAVVTGQQRTALVNRLQDLERRETLHMVGILGVTMLLIVFGLLEIRRSQRRAESEHALRKAATAANTAKSRFLANMSHELRTPLNAIIGFSELMRDEKLGPLGTPVYREYADNILTSGQHLLTILHDVLDVARIEAGRFELHEQDFDPAEAMRTCVRMLEGTASGKNVELTMSTPEAAPTIHGDARLFRQICLNLLGNAIKFTPAGGHVELKSTLTDGAFVLEVVDDGPGIPPDEIEKVIEPFHQSDAGFDRRHEGSGLGLALVKGFAELHGGSFDIDSRFGQGTRVMVRFPPERVVATTSAPSEGARHALRPA